MSEKIFFPMSFIGTSVDFDGKSTWTVSKKLCEEVNQQAKSSHQSRSTANFVCHDENEPDHMMTMKIVMQIPYSGTELESPNERQKQATEKLPQSVQFEFDARKAFALHGFDSEPLMHGFKQANQEADGEVPGGWIIYMLYLLPADNYPGHMGNGSKTRFWSSSASVRMDIRKAFRTAWQSVSRLSN